MLNKMLYNKLKITFVLLLFSICLLFVTVITGNSAVYAVEKATAITQYTVQKGDTLYIIATKYGVALSKLKSENSLISDIIYPGQVLKIPANTRMDGNVYAVARGDSLYFIARKYGVTINEIKSTNNLTGDLIFPGQVLVIPGRSLAAIIADKGINKSSGVFEILVDKSDHVLSVYANGSILKSYHVELGDGGSADKEIAGDHRTPEGTFYICEKLVLNPADMYLGSRWMRLSYPNIEDAARGLGKEIIDQQTYNSILTAYNKGKIPPQRTALGGGVGIHGGSIPEFGKDWTWGCVGLRNKDVEELYEYIRVGTKVIIQK
ncbi:MAG TPA: LysM peptidoglycan-binding domain-containing protein [Clostridiales bacterium]|nr:LysM peptidoglycan-binding domain-containing protein [Clostridiales bacterium]